MARKPAAKAADDDAPASPSQFKPGNQMWRLSSGLGSRQPMFETPEDLWARCVEYFEWNDANPLHEAKLFEGAVLILPKMRAMTVEALCIFLGCTSRAWRKWGDERPDLQAVISRVESIIYVQKFEGASADLLNAGIIQRELGLGDKQTLDVGITKITRRIVRPGD